MYGCHLLAHSLGNAWFWASNPRASILCLACTDPDPLAFCHGQTCTVCTLATWIISGDNFERLIQDSRTRGQFPGLSRKFHTYTSFPVSPIRERKIGRIFRHVRNVTNLIACGRTNTSVSSFQSIVYWHYHVVL